VAAEGVVVISGSLYRSIVIHHPSPPSLWKEIRGLDGGIKQYDSAVGYSEVKRAPVKLTWSYIVAKC
jgi:hypothetical protein